MASNKNLQKDLEAIRADIEALGDTIGKLAAEATRTRSRMAADVRRAARTATDAGEDILEETKHLGRDAAEAASDAADLGLSTIEKEIKRSPVGAVLVALGIGFLIGIIGHR
jgi:ElaB/YqjD/DUF883 family membrane-anchored ribosome-binding protein